MQKKNEYKKKGNRMIPVCGVFGEGWMNNRNWDDVFVV